MYFASIFTGEDLDIKPIGEQIFVAAREDKLTSLRVSWKEVI